jgi:nitroimidazol reductase NimA-like FMN-containing flavoprotein (pyridoxamine 5'-phosphate oxidase superfamily)
MHAIAPLEELSRAECVGLLATTTLGRVGVSIAALPAVLPVNFVVDDGEIVFRSVPGTKFDVATARTIVAFEADHYDPETASGWSVLIRGITREVVDEDELAHLRTLPLTAWAFGGAAERFVRLAMDLVTGSRIVAPAPA